MQRTGQVVYLALLVATLLSTSLQDIGSPVIVQSGNQLPKPECKARETPWEGITQGTCRAQWERGEVVGFARRTARGNREYCSYTGIPYAEPPVGPLRFKSPVAWKGNGTIDATKEPPPCPGKGRVNSDRSTASENCLYLSAYVPKNCGSGPLVVIVWFHWGGFFLGSISEEYTAPDNLLDGCVIVVLVQYRLGPLGFLYGTCEDSNAGLKDQVLALQWVQKNIESFGGDRNRVTIYGESAGGASVSYLLISPLCKGLFTRAIMSSGSAFHPFGVRTPEQARKHTSNLAAAVGCQRTNIADTLRCLQETDVWRLVDNQFNSATIRDTLHLTLFVCVPTWCDTCSPEQDSKQDLATTPFLCKDPHKAFTSDLLNVKEVMVGGNCNEGALLEPVVTQYDKAAVLPLTIGTDPSILVTPYFASCLNIASRLKISNMLRKYYKFLTFTRANLHLLVRIFSQAQFSLPVQRFTYILAGRSDVKVYSYQYCCETEYANVIKAKQGICAGGASHGDELCLVFRCSFVSDANCEYRNSTNRGSTDQQEMDNFVRLITSFASGNPDPPWTPFTLQTAEHLSITCKEHKMVSVLDACDLQEWNKYGRESCRTADFFSPGCNATLIAAKCRQRGSQPKFTENRCGNLAATLLQQEAGQRASYCNKTCG